MNTNANNFIERFSLAILMAVTLCMLLPHLGLIQSNIMETRNLITAREMLHNHDWVFTTINNNPRYEKPPLPTWLTAAAGAVFGLKSMFFLRLPAVLVTLMLVYFFYRMMQALKLQNGQPLHASLILITSFYIFFSGRDNQWDIYAHAFMMAGIFFLYLLFSRQAKQKKYILLAGLFFGLSFLSKGPVSPYALFLPFVAAYFIVYKNDFKKNSLYVLALLAVGLVVGLSWPLYVRFFDANNVHNAVVKEAGRWGGYEIKPFWYYWSFFTQSGIWTIFSFIALLYPYMIKRVADKQAYRFAFWWTIISVLLLSVIPEKKSRYLLPVLIPLAFCSSFYIQYLIQAFWKINNRDKIISVTVFSIIGVVAMILPLALVLIFKAKLTGYIFWFLAGSIVSVGCGVGIFSGLKKKNISMSFYSIIAFMCGAMLFLLPLSKAYYSNNRYFAAASLQSLEQNHHIKSYEYNGFTPEIIWDYGKAIPELHYKQYFLLPHDTDFGLLIIPAEAAMIQRQLPSYIFTKLATVDINEINAGKKGYNDRLVKDYYLVHKK